MTRENLEAAYREKAQVLMHPDILREILPRLELGLDPSGGCRTLPEVREWVDASIHDHDGPETYTEADAEGISRLLLEDVLDLLDQAEEDLRDCEEIAATEQWIHRRLYREGNSGGCSW